MGAKNNHVYQVLVTKGNEAVLAAGKKVEDLKEGQLGVFDTYTNLSVDKDTLPKDFYFAVGIDRDGDGTVDDYNKSAGQMVQKRLVNYVTEQPYKEPQPTIIEISDFIAKCETEYSIDIHAVNSEVLLRMGYLPFKKSYHVVTGCCEECNAGCANNYCNNLVKMFVEAINVDDEDYFYAEAVDADGNVVEDIEAFAEENKTVNTDDDSENDVCLKIRITSKPNLNSFFCALPSKAFNVSGTKLAVFLKEGFVCTGKVEVTQALTFEQGSGLSILNKEYIAGGWNGRPGPYRQSALHGLPVSGFEAFANPKEKYNQVVLGYENLCYSGWGEYLNSLDTFFAIPKDDSTTLDSLKEILETLIG